MDKRKLATGLGAVLVVGSMFTGLSSFLLVIALILIFADIDEQLKAVITKATAFMLAITIFAWIWDLIPDGVKLVESTLDGVINIINGYIESPLDYISLGKFDSYVLSPIISVVKLLDGIVSFIIVIVKLFFAYGIITGKPIKSNIITNKVNEILTKIVNFMNTVGNAAPAAAPAAAPVAPAAQPVAPTNNQTPPTI